MTFNLFAVVLIAGACLLIGAGSSATIIKFRERQVGGAKKKLAQLKAFLATKGVSI